MEPLTNVLRALADPTRCMILELLQTRGRSVIDLTQHFSMSRPAVSKHLAILREAKLVTSIRQGRQQIYELDVAPLSLAREWLDRFDAGAKKPVSPPRPGKRRPAKQPKTKRPQTPRPQAPTVDPDDWRCW